MIIIFDNKLLDVATFLNVVSYSACMGEFANTVFEIVKQVPRGCVATYGQVAKLMGRPQSGRYVGFALRTNPTPGTGEDAIPCHRIVFKDGSLCKGFAFGGPTVQRDMLESEGVVFRDDTHVDLDACLWDGRGACMAGDTNEAVKVTGQTEWAGPGSGEIS